MTLQIEDLPVSNYMTAFPVSVIPSVSLFEAAEFMARKGFGNLIISDDDGNPLGILTEQDLIREIVSSRKVPDIQVHEMSQYTKFTKISPDTTVLRAANIMIEDKARLLVFADDKLVGITTATDLVRAFRKTYVAPPLDNVVSTRIYRIGYDDTVLDTMMKMYEKGIGSIVVEGKQPDYGIFTERDLLSKVLMKRVSLTEPVDSYSTYPLITSKDGILANEAAAIMAKHNIKRLVLEIDGSLSGMVTARDIVDAYQSNSPRLKNY